MRRNESKHYAKKLSAILILLNEHLNKLETLNKFSSHGNWLFVAVLLFLCITNFGYITIFFNVISFGWLDRNFIINYVIFVGNL